MKKASLKNILCFGFALFIAFSLISCGKRDLMSNIITLYNSKMEKTTEFSPLDTLFIKMEGLAANKYYKIEVLDPDGEIITMMETMTNGDGKIGVSPLWFDVGLKKADLDHANPYIESSDRLEVKAFYIQIISQDGKTNFRQPFYLFYNTSDMSKQTPPPIVYACDLNGNISNAFEESGTKKSDGVTDSDLTQVWVKAERIPLRVSGAAVTSVDLYVIPFNGDVLPDQYDLSANAYLPKGPSVAVTADSAFIGHISPTKVWDLSDTTSAVYKQLINPGDTNGAYRVVVDVNKNGKYDVGTDVNADGTIDQHIDGVDGNAVVGFIVQDTQANSPYVEIKDGTTTTANKESTLLENVAGDPRTLYFNMDNVNATLGSTVRVYVADMSTSSGALTDVRTGGFSVVAVSSPSEYRLMPYIHNHPLIKTNSGATYSYTTDIAADKKLDVVVDVNKNGILDDGDYFFSDYITIKAVNLTVGTYSDAACTQQTRFFNKTGSATNTSAYIKFMVTGSNHLVYVLNGKNWSYGNSLTSYIFRQSMNVTNGGNGLLWDLNGSYKVTNPTANNNVYDIIVDMDDSGTYSAGDLSASIVIRAPSLPKGFYANIASGGMSYNDYRDTFAAKGLDTKYAPWYGVSYGIKAMWNPYIRYWAPTTATPNSASVYYGQYVDVYIVDATKYNLEANGVITDSNDVTGRHKVLPIQSSCANGLGQQNIWNAPMVPGKYFVVVDVNRDGKITELMDIIDANKKDGKTILDDATVVGFEVQ